MAKLNPALREFWQTRSRNKILYGGRSSSKTWDAAGRAIWIAQRYTKKFLCTRQFQNKISESVYTVLKGQIERFGLTDQFTITNNRITHNTTRSEFVFYGLWRNIDEIKSLEGIDICWIEEGHNLTQEQWDILEPTIRKDGSEFWLIFNPRLRTDFVYKYFIVNTPENTIKRKINYDENPFLTETMRGLIEAKKEENIEEYRHIYLGEPKSEDVNTLFSYELIESSMNSDPNTEIDRTGVKTLGVDVSDFGDDSTVVTFRRGYEIFDMQSRKNISPTECSTWVAHLYKDFKADGIIVDGIGVGAGAVSRMEELGLPVINGKVSMAADDDRYEKKRTEMYFNLKEWMENGGRIPRDDELMEELAAVTYSFGENGKMRIAKKSDMKELLGRSPDKADSIALNFFTTIIPMSEQGGNYYEEIPNGSW